MTSYTDATVKVKQAPRLHYPNLSPTRPPADPAGMEFWPAWTKLCVEDLDLDQFADDGTPLFDGKGC